MLAAAGPWTSIEFFLHTYVNCYNPSSLGQSTSKVQWEKCTWLYNHPLSHMFLWRGLKPWVEAFIPCTKTSPRHFSCDTLLYPDTQQVPWKMFKTPWYPEGITEKKKRGVVFLIEGPEYKPFCDLRSVDPRPVGWGNGSKITEGPIYSDPFPT